MIPLASLVRRRSCALFAFACLLSQCAHSHGADDESAWDSTLHITITDEAVSVAPPSDKDPPSDEDPPSWLREAALLQDPRPPLPQLEVEPPTGLPSAGINFSFRLSNPRDVIDAFPAARRNQVRTPATRVVFGVESKLRLSTDAGNLLGKSPSAIGIEVQRRAPIVTDPRIRGSRIGRLAGNGSYWVPARLDLDTMLSKIDSRIIDDIIVVKGPYRAMYGPGFSFVDVQLLQSPRYDCGFETHGRTSVDYKTNGEQVSGRQEIWGGDDLWGFRVGYGHRTGNDYRTGTGAEIPSSYNSRDWDVALGRELTEDSRLEFNYLRLDQTNVEFPGQAFDIDFLVTDGYEVEYTWEDQVYFDRLTVDAWYNRTRFEGSAQRPGKRSQFPFYDDIQFVGFTDVDSLSTGFRSDLTWGDDDDEQLKVGTDLRYIKQELNEISSGRTSPLTSWTNANSPIPDSYSANPGLFIEYINPATERTTITAGARADSVLANVTDDPMKLAALGLEVPQHSLEQILGSDQFDQSFTLWSGYVTAEHALNECWTFDAGFGYAERPPTLTSLYAAQTFMFLIQNGLNTVTGDPTLSPERVWQMDIGLDYNSDRFRAGAHGFHAWLRDYITWEATRTFTTTHLEQVSLQFVNTDLATLAGGELYAEHDANDWLTSFATLQYVEGRDHTRNGTFATQRATGGMSAMKVIGLPRGFFSGLGGAAQEPLPGIAPLESRLGIRIHEPRENPLWSVEIAARVVDNQDRVATSLGETPTPGFTVWDVRGFWQPLDDLLLVAGVENFTDLNYQEHLDFRSENGIRVFEPGVNFYFGGELTY